MTASWPTELPQKPLVQGYVETPEDTRIRSETDTGPAKLRARSTTGVRQVVCAFAMTTSQLTIFETFWRDTLERATLPYTWAHPRTDVVGTWRLVKIGPYRQRSPGGRWIIDVELELLP